MSFLGMRYDPLFVAQYKPKISRHQQVVRQHPHLSLKFGMGTCQNPGMNSKNRIIIILGPLWPVND